METMWKESAGSGFGAAPGKIRAGTDAPARIRVYLIKALWLSIRVPTTSESANVEMSPS